MRPSLRAVARCASVGATAPAGRMEVLAGARADPTKDNARIVRAEAAIQPEDRRRGFDIVSTLTSSVNFGTRLERAVHLSKYEKRKKKQKQKNNQKENNSPSLRDLRSRFRSGYC